ncbi:Hypothetical protein SCF082_LOCUS25423 [Durusdinium trenchii]|uniref:Uncharacterized protein n=1 Tax=Durusdinium trenchii TaxID=1381693 RepID=A0ABP0M1G8_9DINO
MGAAWLAVVLAWTALTLQGCLKTSLSTHTTHTTWTGPVGTKCSRMNSHGRQMDCGSNVEVCGVLTLETGEGKGNYQHPEPVVHGLWPQTSGFGTSECDAPDSSADPAKIYPCFDTQGSASSALWFQRHEWEKHGMCAGVRNADDFFRQVCQLSSAPLQVMAGARAADLDLVDTADQLQRAGFCVYHLDNYNKQVQLSACQDQKGTWHLADVNSFSRVCGGGSSGGTAAGQCITGQRGPRCSSDADCWNKANCQRCAHSGYCTDVPLRALSESESHGGFAFDKEHSPSLLVVNVSIMTVYCALLLTLLWLRRAPPDTEGLASAPLISADREA